MIGVEIFFSRQTRKRLKVVDGFSDPPFVCCIKNLQFLFIADFLFLDWNSFCTARLNVETSTVWFVQHSWWQGCIFWWALVSVITKDHLVFGLVWHTFWMLFFPEMMPTGKFQTPNFDKFTPGILVNLWITHTHYLRGLLPFGSTPNVVVVACFSPTFHPQNAPRLKNNSPRRSHLGLETQIFFCLSPLAVGFFEVATGIFFSTGLVRVEGLGGQFATETGEYTDIGDHHGRRCRRFFFFGGRGWVRNVIGEIWHQVGMKL